MEGNSLKRQLNDFQNNPGPSKIPRKSKIITNKSITNNEESKTIGELEEKLRDVVHQYLLHCSDNEKTEINELLSTIDGLKLLVNGLLFQIKDMLKSTESDLSTQESEDGLNLKQPLEKGTKWLKDEKLKLERREDRLKKKLESSVDNVNKVLAVMTTGKKEQMNKVDRLKSCIKEQLEHIKKLKIGIEKQKGDIQTKVNKTKQSVKRQTISGDEYQRVLQILLRQRAMKTKDSKVGIEVTGVGDLDDIVYINSIENKSRFFQVKHFSKKHILTKKVLFRSEFPVIINKDGKQINKKIKPNLHLLLYFKSFCNIKENPKFKNVEIEEISLITNAEMESDEGNDDSMMLICKSLNRDKCLNLKRTKPKKYGLNVERFKAKFYKYLESQAKEYLISNINKAPQIIHEFIEKTSIIVNYPDLDDLQHLVLEEVLGNEMFYFKNNETLKGCLIYIEIKLLKDTNEFISNNRWNKEIMKIKNLMNGLIAFGLSDHRAGHLSRHFIEFENIMNMVNDIRNLLLNDSQSILNCEVKNLELNVLKVLCILKQMEHEKINSLQKYKYCEFEDLPAAGFLIEYFESGNVDLLVISCGTNNDNEEIEELPTTLNHVLNNNTSKKVILISRCDNEFISKLKELGKEKYSKKLYESRFEDLSTESKEKIMQKNIIFQNEEMTLQTLLNSNEDFADKVIDENCMWEIINAKPKSIILSNSDSFDSYGYVEQYYIPRSFSQNLVEYNTLKIYLKEEVFFITGECGIQGESMKDSLTMNGINEKDIQVWNHKDIYSNGIVLSMSQEQNNYQIFDQISKQASVHWLIMNKKLKLLLIDSRESTLSEENLVKQSQDTSIKEDDFFESCEDTVVLVAGSGVGKSTVLTRMANQVRRNDRSVWIIKINLRTFFNKNKLHSLRNLNNTDAAVDCIKEMVFMNSSASQLQENLLKEGLKKSQKENFKSILLLDGYNEITRTSQIAVCNFIKTLKTYCNINKIWVTTQMQDKIELESTLEVPAYFLDTLHSEDQIELMARYWLNEYKQQPTSEQYTYEELFEDAGIALKKWKKSISDENKEVHFDKTFTEVPLNLLMLSDVLIKRDRKINKSTNLVKLYNDFISNKFALYNREITGSENKELPFLNKVKDQLFEDCIRKILQELSVRIIWSKYPNKKKKKIPVHEMPEFEKFKAVADQVNTNQILSKIGLLTFRKGEIDFSHYSFAQFFFSEYLITNLDKTDVQVFLMKKVLSEKSLELCRKFFNRSLKCNLEVQKRGHTNIRTVDVFKQPFKKTASKVLLKTNRLAAITPIKEDLDVIVMMILQKLDLKDCKSYLDSVVRNDFQFYGIEEELIDEYIDCLLGKNRKETSKILTGCKMIGQRITQDSAKINFEKENVINIIETGQLLAFPRNSSTSTPQ